MGWKLSVEQLKRSQMDRTFSSFSSVDLPRLEKHVAFPDDYMTVVDDLADMPSTYTDRINESFRRNSIKNTKFDRQFLTVNFNDSLRCRRRTMPSLVPDKDNSFGSNEDMMNEMAERRRSIEVCLKNFALLFSFVDFLNQAFFTVASAIRRSSIAPDIKKMSVRLE